MEHTYYCGTKRCREYHKRKVYSVSPREMRLATGQCVKCAGCLQPMHYEPRPVKTPDSAASQEGRGA